MYVTFYHRKYVCFFLSVRGAKDMKKRDPETKIIAFSIAEFLPAYPFCCTFFGFKLHHENSWRPFSRICISSCIVQLVFNCFKCKVSENRLWTYHMWSVIKYFTHMEVDRNRSQRRNLFTDRLFTLCKPSVRWLNNPHVTNVPKTRGKGVDPDADSGGRAGLVQWFIKHKSSLQVVR